MGEIFCGIDWAESHHDVAVVDGAGRLLFKRRISDDMAGFTLLSQLWPSTLAAPSPRSTSRSRPTAVCSSRRCAQRGIGSMR